jgi:hypothetical protein
MGCSTDNEKEVERAEGAVPDLDGGAEARDRAGRFARRPFGEGRVPQQRAQWIRTVMTATSSAEIAALRSFAETHFPDGAGPAIGVQDMPPRDDA